MHLMCCADCHHSRSSTHRSTNVSRPWRQ
jgi:hypothetical protein